MSNNQRAQYLVTKYKVLPHMNLPQLLRIQSMVTVSLNSMVNLQVGTIREPYLYYALNDILLELSQRIRAHNPPM